MLIVDLPVRPKTAPADWRPPDEATLPAPRPTGYGDAGTDPSTWGTGTPGQVDQGLMTVDSVVQKTAISIALQYGVPLDTLVRKFAYMRFEPEGITTNPEIPFAKSMPDYIMRWLASRFLDADTQEELGILTPAVRAKKTGEDLAIGADGGGSRPANGGASAASAAKSATSCGPAGSSTGPWLVPGSKLSIARWPST